MMRPALQLRLGQQLSLTPQLQQALKLLAMPQAQLEATLKLALESNVMLEALDAGDAAREPDADGFEAGEPAAADDADSDAEGDAASVEADWGSLESEGSWDARGSGVLPEFDVPVTLDLRQHLLAQLPECRFSAADAETALALIDALDDQGYLAELSTAIAADLEVEAAEVEAVRHRLQRLDPVGTCSVDLADCLGVQLGELAADAPALTTARRLVAEHIARLGRAGSAELATMLGVGVAEVETALKLIRSLNPRPAASLPADATEYVRPDLRVRRGSVGWTVELDLAGLPALRVNEAYARALSTTSGRGANAGLREQLAEARWLIKSLAMRNATLLRVATAVVSRQVEFLERGAESLKPLLLREIAAELELHESTVSRVTTGKWLLTPRGMFELRTFFSNQVAGEASGGVSATAARAVIQRLVEAEDSRRPLSDEALVQALAAQGIRLARRTVTKYREALAIPASYERRSGA
jgi:RNA polymerase sigma-54 factor